MKCIRMSMSVLFILLLSIGLFTIVPFPVSAATQSGTTGDCTWTLDEETGVLTISGTGSMANYQNSGSAPWGSGITKVVVENGVTNIGNYAFCWCGELKSISMPESLLSIGDYAFAGSGLVSVTIPESVTTIGNHTFFSEYGYCRKITFLGTPVLGDGMFMHCVNACQFVFEKSMQFNYFDTSALPEDECGLTSDDIVIIPDGCTYLKNGEVIPLTAENAREVFADATVLFPEAEDENISWSFDETTGVLTISGTGAMKDYNKNVVAVSETQMALSTSAPWGGICRDIQSVVIEEGVTSVGAYAFYNIGDEATGSMMSKIHLPSTIKRIGQRAFCHCEQLTEINLPEGLEALGELAFCGCKKINNIILPDNLKTIEKQTFRSCSELSEIHLSENLEAIGEVAFSSCYKLESIMLPSHLKSIGPFAFANSSIKKVTIPESVETIGQGAFQHAKVLEEVTVLCRVMFENAVFYGCSSLKWIRFEKQQQFQENEFLFQLGANHTVFVAEGSTYLKNGTETVLTAENAYDVFHGAKMVIMPYAAGHSIALNGDIGLNYYFSVSDDLLAAGTQLHFAWYNKICDHTVTAEDFDAASGYYKVQVNVAAAEMTYPITASCTLNGIQLDAIDVYSVRDYADVILDSDSDFSKGYVSSNGESSYALLADLIKKMLDYGAKAQTRFGVTDIGLANAGIDYTMQPVTVYHIKTQKSDMKKDLYKYGLNYLGTTIVYLSGMTLRHYYVVTDANLFRNVKNTANLDFVEKGQRICFEKKNIPAAQLDVDFVFTLGDSAYSYSVLDYCKLVLADESKSQADEELAMATYWYNDAAKAYFYTSSEYEDDMM